MIRQVVFVPLDQQTSMEDRTKAIEAACNWDWLAEYRLVSSSLVPLTDAGPAAGTEFGLYLFFEKD